MVLFFISKIIKTSYFFFFVFRGKNECSLVKKQLNINIYLSFQGKEQTVAQPGKSWASCFVSPVTLQWEGKMWEE